MKYFLGILLLGTLTSVYGVVKLKDQKIKSQGKTEYKDYLCKSKILPINVKYSVTDTMIKVDFTFEKDLKAYQVFNAKGIDGLDVFNFSKSNAKDVLNKGKESLEFEYSKSTGLAYLVLEVRAKINGTSRIQMMTIPVGEQSREQVNENAENVVTKESPSDAGKFGTKTSRTKKIHKLKLEKLND